MKASIGVEYLRGITEALRIPSTESFRADINGLRALAVISVIAFHFDLFGARSGYVGVDVFFVISGFLIGGQISAAIARGQFSIVAFFASRIRRIVPALLLVCFSVYLWGWLFQLPHDYKLLGRNILSAVFFVSNIAFSRQLGYFDLGALYKPLLHTWSLSVEAQFYFVLPFFLLLVFKLPKRLRLPATFTVGLMSFAASLYLGSKAPDAVFYSFIARGWEFIIGCLVAWFTRSDVGVVKLPAWFGTALLFAAWAALVATCILLPKGIAWPGLWTLAPTLLVACILLIGTGRTAGWLVRSRPVQHVGTISYSLYLWHWPILVFWTLTNGETVATTGIASWVLLGATWLLAWLSWRFVEQPFRRNRVIWTTPRLYKGYAAMLTVCLIASGLIWKYKGVPERLPPYLKGAIMAADEVNDCRGPLNAENKQASAFACVLGNTRVIPPTFVLWGDSHVFQFIDTLRSELEGKPLSGFAFHHPGCEPRRPNPSKNDLCDVRNIEVLHLLEQTPSIRTVVIAIRQNDRQRVERAIEETRRLLDKGYQVIFLGPLPEAKRAVAQEWATMQLRLRKPVLEITISRDAESRVESFNKRLIHWRNATSTIRAVQTGRLVTIELTDAFCDKTQCWFVHDGVGLFRDADHLTYAGARRVTPLLLRALEGG